MIRGQLSFPSFKCIFMVPAKSSSDSEASASPNFVLFLFFAFVFCSLSAFSFLEARSGWGLTWGGEA